MELNDDNTPDIKKKELVYNIVPEGAEYDVFSENTTETLIKAENMNRDYLKNIYNEDMEFLNKEVKMTRSQYIKNYSDIEKHFADEKKRFVKYILFITAVFVILLSVGIWALHEWDVCRKLYIAINEASSQGVVSISNSEYRGIWALTGLYGCIGWISICIGFVQFVFLASGYLKKIRLLEKNKIKSLKTLDERKRDAMLLGQYDSLK